MNSQKETNVQKNVLLGLWGQTDNVLKLFQAKATLDSTFSMYGQFEDYGTVSLYSDKLSIWNTILIRYNTNDILVNYGKA